VVYLKQWKSVIVLVAFSAIALTVLYLVNRQGGRWSESWETSFEKTQPSVAIMDTLGICWGMKVAEIGAGNGRIAVKMARRVGPDGKVYANDVDSTAVAYMRQRIKYESIGNMNVILGEKHTPNLPECCADLIYLVNTYEYLSRPVALLKAAKTALRPGGRLAIIAEDPQRGQGRHPRAASRAQVIFEAEEAGYRLERESDFLDHDNIYIFTTAESSEKRVE